MDVAAMTLDAYLDEWLALMRSRVQPTTWVAYERVRRLYLRPTLGSCPIGDLTVRQLNLHFVSLLRQGGQRGGPLTRATVHKTHTVFRQALGQAVRDGHLADNLAARVTLPRLDPERDPDLRMLSVWTAEQAARFLALRADHPLHGLWRAALGTGMRRGELLGLRWQDVDLDTRQLRVRTSLIYADGRVQLTATKTGRGRVISIDDDTAAAITRQPRPAHEDWPLVFTTLNGMPWHPDAISGRWRRQWPALELPQIRLHDLRHSHATLLLDQGVPIKVVSERLGHASITTTLDIYAHVLPAQDRDAATAIRRALNGNGLNRSRPEPEQQPRTSEHL